MFKRSVIDHVEDGKRGRHVIAGTADAVGDLVAGDLGWQTVATSDGKGLRKIDPAVAPLSAHLGVLGMPSFTA